MILGYIDKYIFFFFKLIYILFFFCYILIYIFKVREYFKEYGEILVLSVLYFFRELIIVLEVKMRKDVM